MGFKVFLNKHSKNKKNNFQNLYSNPRVTMMLPDAIRLYCVYKNCHGRNSYLIFYFLQQQKKYTFIF